jgi:hypothetical protein
LATKDIEMVAHALGQRILVVNVRTESEFDAAMQGRKTTAPVAPFPGGAADIDYSAGGLINAIAFRWRANLGSFGYSRNRSVSMSPFRAITMASHQPCSSDS